MSSATRMRVPHKVHILSWAIALERSGSVPCHFKDCQFMALSLEEMGNHYPFCACENNKYPFVCETCSRRTDTMEKLLLHKLYSHSYKPTDEESRMIDSYLAIPVKKEITSILRRSWEIFLDRKKYLKCLMRKCLFVTHSLSDMEDHYLNFCKEDFWSKLKYDCVYCNGRLPNDYDLKLHIKKAHGSKTYLIKTNVEPDDNQKNIQMWSEEIMLYKQGKCFVEGCQFVDNYVKILEKHYANCDGTRKDFIVCYACGSWLLNEARLNEHKRCFHKDLDEEDFKRLSHQCALESENHSSLLLDDMSPDENDSISGEAEVDNERRAIDLKKYNGVINRASQRSPSVRLSSPVFPAKNTDSIDCAQVADKSGIQFASDIVEINEGSLDIIDIDSSVTKKVLNDGMKLNDKIKRRKSNTQYITEKNRIKDEKKTFSVFHKRNHENWSTTPLQAFANEMMKENKNISTVPVQIKVDNKDWTVNVSTTVVSQTKSSSEFPKNRDTLFKSLKEESYRLLKLVSKKNSIRNDVRMVFDPNENRITPFHINFTKGNSSSDKGPDNLDMTKFLSSDVESDDDLSNSDMSEYDGHDLISCPVSLPSVEPSCVKVPNEVQNNINGGPNHFCGSGNKIDTTLSTTMNHCNHSEEKGSEFLSNNEKFPNSCRPGSKCEIIPQNRIKTEINHDDNAKDFRGKEVSRNSLSEGSDILCLSDVNHLGEEVVVKKESDHKVLPKKIIIEEAGSVVQIEVLSIEGGRQDAVTKPEGGAESEYIIPEIDFIDNAGFSCPNGNTNESDPFHADISHSSYDFESDTGVDLIEDDVSDMQSNNTSEEPREKYIAQKSNKDLVLLDGELPTSSQLATDSGVMNEKDPLSVDGFTEVALFCDSESNDDNRELDSSDKIESALSENNIDLPDNNENGISDNTQESNEESTNDFNLSKKWNWSNLKKYNSKTTHNDLTKMDSRHCTERFNKPSKEDENFLGFIDCSDLSSKYSDFVSACTKLGYYDDDMVILNQHYEIIPPNKKDLKLLHSETTSHGLLKEPLTSANRDHNDEISVKKISDVNTYRLHEGPLEKSQVIDNHESDNDQEDAFLGFKPNDNYTEFRRKSIEISRRLSAEFSDGTNKIDQHLSNTIENISCSQIRENEKNPAAESSVGNCEVSSDELKLKNQTLQQDASSVNNEKSDLNKLDVDSNGVEIRENTRIASTEPTPKKRGRPKKIQCTQNTDSSHEELKLSENDKSVNHQIIEDPNLVVMIVGTEDKTECNSVSSKSPSLNVIDLVQGTNDSQVNTDVIVKAVGCQSADDISLIPKENSFSCGLDIDLNEVKNKENAFDDTIESVQKKRCNPKENSSQLVKSSSTEQVNVVSLITDNADTEVKELGALINDGRSVMNDLPEGSEPESMPIQEINVDHDIENFRDREQVNIVSDHSVDHVSLIPLENKENVLSKPVESVPKKRGRPKKNQSQSITSEIAIDCNGILDLKEEATGGDESDQFPTNEESVNELPDISVAPSLSMPCNNASPSPKSPDSKLTSSSQSMNCTEEDNNASHDEIKVFNHDSDKLNSSAPGESSFITEGNSIISSCVSVQKKRGRPRKNSVNLITSTPNDTTNSSDNQNGENAKTDESYTFDNGKSILNSIADEHNLSANDFIYKNDKIMTEPSTNGEISSVFEQEDTEDRPEKKLKMESTVSDGFPVKRKPGRPPKRLSSCFQSPEQLQRKSDILDYSTENKSLGFKSSASLQCEQLATSERKDMDEESKIILLTKKEDILKMPLKRKPGRPPRRLSLCVKESEVLKTNSTSGLVTSITIGESENKSLLLNSTANSESESVEQKDMEEKSKDILQIKKKDISETQLKRKPGRPPKRLSMKGKEISQHHKEINSVLIENSDSSMNDRLITNSFSNDDNSCANNELQIRELKSESVLGKDYELENKSSSAPILKRKPGRPPKHSLLHHGEVKKCHVTESRMEQKDSMEPPLKRKPGRPPKCLYRFQQKTLQSSMENTNVDISTGNIDLDPLCNKEVLSPEVVNETLGNKEENSLELIEKIPDIKLNRICMSQPNLEECQFENNSVSGKESEHSADKSLSNSFSCGENLSNVSLSKDVKNEQKVEEKDIVEPPLKRKPGRPPKRLSMGQHVIGQCALASIAKDSDRSTISSVLSSSSNVDSLSYVLHSENSTNKLEVKEKNDVEPPLKRKPGRPPKRLSIGQQGIDKCRIGGIIMNDTMVRNRSLDNSLLSSFANENDLSLVSHSEEDIKNKIIVEKKVSFEAPLKRKPGRPPKYLSVSQQGIHKFQNTNHGNQNVILNSSVTDHSEPAPKRKPGRPRKVSLELKNTVENDKNNSVQDVEHYSIKMENESSFITDDNSLDALQSQDANVGCVESSQSVPKRKPGRPRKVSIFLGESSNASYKIVFENGDFSVQSSSPLESSVNSEHTPKRRPGRPRKIKSEQEVITIPERERRLGRVATSTPFANDRASSLSFNSFADLELLDDSNLDEYEGSIKKAGRAKRGYKGFRGRRRDRTYSETYYTTFNDDDTNLETSGTAQTQNRIPNIDTSSNVNSEDGCDNDAMETDLSQEKDSLDESELTSKQKARIEKRKLLSGRVDSVTKLKNPNDKVKCALCGEIMTVIHYQQVHLPKHNFLAWLEGEEPLPLDDFDAMDTLLVRGKRAHPKFIFKCEVCNLEKKSSRGFLSHRQFCGKSDKERENMMVLCVYCGRPMMPSSLQPHLYQCHRTESALTLSEDLELTSGSVRKAAAKCLGKIASIIEEDGLTKNGEDFHLDGDEEFDEIEEISLLYIPVQKRKPSKHMMNRWKQLAADNEELRCMVPTCRFRTWLIRDIVEHHKSCSADGSQGYSCIKCNYICKVEDEMREHVKTCNPPIMVSQSDNSEDEDHEKHVMIPYLRTAEQNLNVRYKVLFFKPALAWMKEIYKKYFTQEPLYPDLPLNLDLWEEMDPQTSQFFNPEKSNSMMVSFQNSSWESMHALEGKVIEGDQGIAYTGGPVWGLEWCPGEGPQYLAVSSHLSMEFNFQAGSTFTGPGLVQLWSLEDISNDKSDSLSTLQFCYGVCHNERACWNIAWCPSGGRTDTRIGLLALATTSGSIPIYAMPNPECLQYQSTRFYKPDPVLKLELWSNERWQCSAISWSKIKPHNIIAAGFVNGMVAVWNLETKSNLLRKKIILYPFKVFQAHHSIITGVCLSPESDSYLATASYDKSFKYWDLVDTTAPHTVLKRGLFTSVDWLRHWMSAVTTYDNAYTMMQTTVSLSSLRGFVNPTTPVVTSINSTAWSVSVNDWLNGAITSYDNGQVVLFLALRQSIYHHLDKRKFSKVILNSTLHNIEAKDGPIEPNSKQKEKETYINNMPSNSYGDAVHKYGLSIRTDPDIGKNDKFQEKSPENMNDIYPLSSINRVAWNTNRKSFLYTAMGYQSGFFVVSKLSFHSKDSNVADELSKL